VHGSPRGEVMIQGHSHPVEPFAFVPRVAGGVVRGVA